MYEFIDEDNIVLNIDANDSIYTDESIGEITTGNECLIFSNDLYMINLTVANNVSNMVLYKIYRKTSPIYEISRINFFKNEYVGLNYFKLTKEELELFNKAIHTKELIEPAINQLNKEMFTYYEYIGAKPKFNEIDFPNIKDMWRNISIDQVLYYRFNSLKIYKI